MQITPMLAGLVWTMSAACDRPAFTSEQSRKIAEMNPASVASNEPKPPSSVADSAPLRIVGQQTVDALTNGDDRFLASTVDEKGIALGTDNPLMTASEFKRDLNSKTGVYCDLFGCKSVRSSIRALLSGKTLSIRAVTSSDSFSGGQVDVFELKTGNGKSEAAGSPLLTLFFVNREGTWRLTSIEYT